MFENLLSFWKGKDFLKQVLDEFKRMLTDAQDMFDCVCKKLIDNTGPCDLKDRVYGVDVKINELQKDIRKRIVAHLSVNPRVDTPACLLLMSVVKDAERLGDYCKNLFEVTQLLKGPMNKGKYQALFDEIHKDILELFAQTNEAFVESDEKKAGLAWDKERKIVKRCDEIIEKLSKSDFSVNEAVTFTLIARYFKRIAAHLTNIATSVILPISELDYFDERR